MSGTSEHNSKSKNKENHDSETDKLEGENKKPEIKETKKRGSLEAREPSQR